jgi:hypothetical protein
MTELKTPPAVDVTAHDLPLHCPRPGAPLWARHPKRLPRPAEGRQRRGGLSLLRHALHLYRRARQRVITKAGSGASAATDVKILVVAPSWIGDTILAQPLLARLHQAAQSRRWILDAFAAGWACAGAGAHVRGRRRDPNPFAHGEVWPARRWRAGRANSARDYDAAYRPAELLEIRPDALLCRHPAAHRLPGRGALRLAQ